MSGVVLGTAGHVDHGKTSLVRALTGVDTDRWKEEKERGLTIDIGFARLGSVGDAVVGVVDVPGHEDFVKNMLAGSTGIDLLLLVVAADEGPMPQTREHLSIARLLGVERGIVALNRVDRADPELRELAREAAAEEVREVLGHDRWPILPVSAATGEGIEALRAEILRQAEVTRRREEDDLFRMPIDRSFTIRGAGTVLTGTVWSGRLECGATARLLPDGRGVRIRSIEVHGEPTSVAVAGCRTALSAVGVQPSETRRGAVLVDGEAWRPVRRLGARIELLRHSPRPLEHGRRVRVYLGTTEVLARVALADRGVLRPGASAWAALALETPLVARARDPFVLRFYSPVTTIGGGRVAEPAPPAGWRARVGEWERILAGSAADAFASAVRLAGGAGAGPAGLPLATGRPPGELPRPADEPEGTVWLDGRWFDADRLRAARRSVLDRLAEAHEGNRRASAISVEEIRSAAGAGFAPALVERAIRDLAREGELEVEGPSVRLAGRGAELTAEEERALGEVARVLREGGLAPPAVDEIAGRLGLARPLLHDLLRLLQERRRIVPLTPELFLDVTAAEEARRRALDLLGRRGRATAAEFKEAFGVSRKFLIPILEYLDRSGATRRVGEAREPAGR